MEGNGIQNSDVATLSLLGGGYGYGGRGYGHEFANDASNAVRINSSKDASAASHDSLSQQISDNADRNRDISALQSQNARDISARDLDTQIALSLSQQVARGEDNINAHFNAQTREMNANARAAAECCCEAKLLAVQNQAKTDAGLAQVLANQAADVRVADAVANAAQNAKLDALLSERSGHHGRG